MTPRRPGEIFDGSGAGGSFVMALTTSVCVRPPNG
jgi:hypothetical protein